MRNQRLLPAVIASLFSACASALPAVIQLQDIASLASVSTATDGDTAIVAGYSAAGDGGGGTFVFKAASMDAPDGGLTIARSAGGRWLRVTSSIDVRMFGARGDGIKNDRLAIQAAIDAATRGGYQSVIFGGGKRYYVAGSTSEASLTEGDWVPAPAFRGILKIGFHGRKNVTLVSAGTDQLTIPAHRFESGEAVVVSTTGRLPGVSGMSLYAGLFYYVAKVDADTISLFRDSSLSQIIDFTDSGVGTFQVEKSGGSNVALTFTGEGSTIFTDDEAGSATVTNYGQRGKNDFASAPSIFLVKTNFSSLTIKDLILERTITGGRKSVPGNYQAAGGSTAPGSLQGGQKSYLDLPNGFNRVGILLMPGSPEFVDSISLRNVAFIDCHNALTATHVPAVNLRDYYGKLTTLTIDGCRFVHPSGSNITPGAPFGGSGGIGLLLTNWIGTARVTGCDFDGAAGSVADSGTSIAVDGFVFGSPDRLICTNNKVRHCAVEYIYHFPAWNLAWLGDSSRMLTMPRGNETATLELDYPNALPPWVGIGQRIYLGPGDADAAGNRRSAGFMRIESIENSSAGGTRNRLKLSNLGGEYNVKPGEAVNLRSCWISIPEYGAHSSSLIAENEIDCSPVAGYAGVAPQTAYGGPAIRVDNCATIISGNRILNTTAAIQLSETMASENRMWGSIVSDNSIQLANTRKIVTHIDTNTNRLITAGHIWDSRDWVVVSSSGTLPSVSGGPLVAGVRYYVKKIDDLSLELFRDGSLSPAQLVDFTSEGEGEFGITNFYGSFGLNCGVKGAIIKGNSIWMPYANHCYGIQVSADYCRLINNSITAIARDPKALQGAGISVGNGLLYCSIEGNTTRNMQTAIGNGGGEGSHYTIESHHSIEDGQGPVLNQTAIFRHQEVQFQPAAEGWYRIARQAYTPFAGELTITSREPFGYMEAIVKVDHQAYGARSLVQESFNASLNVPPIIDQMLLSGAGDVDLLVHVTRPANLPIILRFKTDVEGSFILSKPQTQEEGPAYTGRNITNISTSGAPGNLSATIETQLPHSVIAGATIYLLDTPAELRLNGTYVVASVPDAKRFTVALAPEAQSTTTASGSYFTSTGGSAHPVGLDKFLTFSRGITLEAPAQGGGILNTDAAAGTNGGVFLDNVSSVGLAINGSLVLRHDSNGLDATGIPDVQLGYSFDGDDDTGIFHPANDTIAFATGGVERARIGNSGLSIGSGIAIEKVSRAAVSPKFGTIAARSTNEVAVVVDGAGIGDAVIVNPAYPLVGLSARVVYNAYVSDANTVTIRATNVSGSATEANHKPALSITVISFGN